jgi:hypothetical protein
VPFLLSFDVDAEEDIEAIPRVLDLLRAHRLPAGFACVGEWVERFPAEHWRIVAEGHEVVNHGYANHTARDGRGVLVPTGFYHALGRPEMDRDIRAGHAALGRILGLAPAGFRAPHFATLRRRHLGYVYETLRALGYRYSSSTALGSTGDGIPSLRDGIVELPVLGCPQHPASVFDSWHLVAAPDRPHGPGDLLRLGRRILTEARGSGPSWINLYFDPSVSRATREFEDLLSLVAAADHLEPMALGAFAARWHQATLASREQGGGRA